MDQALAASGARSPTTPLAGAHGSATPVPSRPRDAERRRRRCCSARSTTSSTPRTACGRCGRRAASCGPAGSSWSPRRSRASPRRSTGLANEALAGTRGFETIVEARPAPTAITANPDLTGRPEWFTTAYFHRPGGAQRRGRGRRLRARGARRRRGRRNPTSWPSCPLAGGPRAARSLMRAIARVESEPSLLGASPSPARRRPRLTPTAGPGSAASARRIVMARFAGVLFTAFEQLSSRLFRRAAHAAVRADRSALCGFMHDACDICSGGRMSERGPSQRVHNALGRALPSDQYQGRCAPCSQAHARSNHDRRCHDGRGSIRRTGAGKSQRRGAGQPVNFPLVLPGLDRPSGRSLYRRSGLPGVAAARRI